MDIEGRRRSSNFEDRGRGGGGGGGGGLGMNALSSLVRLIGLKGTAVLGALLGIGYFVAPAGVKQMIVRALGGGAQESGATQAGAGSVCQAAAENGKGRHTPTAPPRE